MSIVKVPVPATDVFPKVSAAVALTGYVPSASEDVMSTNQDPLDPAVATYVSPSTVTVIEAFASAVPVILGVVFVVVSLFIVGAEGASVSIVRVPVPGCDVFPSSSVAVALTI